MSNDVMRYAVRFLGSMEDLSDRGFSFHRLYAGDYDCYVREDVQIWVDDRAVEFLSLSGHSGALLAYMIDVGFPETVRNVNGKEMKCLTLDRWTGEFLAHDVRYHDDFSVYGDEEASAMYNPDRYLVVYGVKSGLIEVMRELYNAGEIELLERV